MEHDLNTKLSNYEATATARADHHRAAATEARSRPKTEWGEYDRQTEDEARKEDAEAAKWSNRGDYARKGLMLVDDDDVRHQHEYGDLIDSAAREHRVVRRPDAQSDPYEGTPLGG